MTRWILQCNPERYRLSEALLDGFAVASWTVMRYLRDIAPGDEIAMWVSGAEAGICALGEVTREAVHSGREPDPYWVDPADARRESWHIGIRLGEPLAKPVRRSELAADPVFAGALIVRMPGGGNPFPVTDLQWKAVTSRITSSARGRTRSSNPNWTRDELILALDVYLRDRGHIPSPLEGRIVELSDLLNRLPIHTVRPHLEKFRNPNGVVLKITNFAALDSRYPGTGMTRGSRLDAVVWDQYSDKPEVLIEVADAIRAAAASDLLPAIPDADEEDVEADEGRLLTRLHRVRERNRKLVERKKATELSRRGTLPCEICGFDFATTYGPLGERFIEAHHILPLAQAGTTTTRLTDLALVCANCHRMLHKARPWLTPAQLRNRLAGP